FCSISDVLRNRPIALSLHLPVIFGLDEVIDGTLLSWLGDLGHITMSVEGGKHDDPKTVDFLESAIWVALVAAGSLGASGVPRLNTHHVRLRRVGGGRPRVLQVRHRGVVKPDDGISMAPGFVNLEPMRRNQLLAHRNGHEIRASQDGWLLMPLY